MNEELYQVLKSAGFYTKSYDEFQTKYGSPEGQRQLYDVLHQGGYYTKDFDSFTKKYSKPVQNTFAQDWEAGTTGAPVLDNFIIPVTKQIAQGFGDQIPKSVVGSEMVIADAIEGGNTAKELLANDLGFQKFVRSKDPYFGGVLGFLKPFNSEEWIDKYAEEYTKPGGGLAATDEKLKEIQVNRDLPRFQYMEQQDKEAAATLQGNVQSYKDVSGLGSAINYGTNQAAQAVWQIPLTVLTRGASSLAMESAEVLDQNISQVADREGISREEVIKRNLADPTGGQEWAILAAAMDKIGTDRIAGLFKPGGASVLKKVIAAATEGATEAVQGSLEQVGGATASGQSGYDEFKKAWTEDIDRRIDEAFGGILGAGTATLLSPSSTVEQEAPKEITPESKQIVVELKAAANEITTGDVTVDAQIDQEVDKLASEIDAILDKENLDDSGKTLDDLNADAKAIDKWIAEFEASQQADAVDDLSTNELNEINPSVQLTPQEVTNFQAKSNVGLNRFNDTMLDDSVQTPALDAKIEAAQTTTPTEQITTQAEVPLLEESAVKKPKAVKPKTPKVDKELLKQEKLNAKKIEQFVKREANLDKYKPAKRVEQMEKLIEDSKDLDPELSRRVDKKLQELKDKADDTSYIRTLKASTPAERIQLIKQNVAEDTNERDMIDAVDNINWMVENQPDNLDAIEESLSQIPDLKEQLSENTGLTSIDTDTLINTLDEIKSKGEGLLAERVKAKKEEKQRITGNKDSFLTAVAANVRDNNEEGIAKAVQKYKDWRSQEGLKEMSTQEILKKAEAPHYKNTAKNAVSQGYKASNILGADLIKKLNLKGDEGDITPILGIKDANISAGYEGAFENIRPANFKEVADNIEQYYTEWFGEVGGKSMANVASNMFKLGEAVQRAVSGKPMEVYYGEATGNVLGFHYYEGSTGRNILLLPSNKYTGSTELHEVMHLFQAAINQGAALLDSKSFTRKLISKFSRKTNANRIIEETQELYNKVNAIHGRFYKSLMRDFKDMAIKLNNNQTLSNRENALINSTVLYVEEVTGRRGELFGQISDKSLVKVALEELQSRDAAGKRNSTTLYGTTMGVEMMAEALSNPYFASMMLHTSYSPALIKTNVSSKSYLAELAQTFLEYINSVLKTISLPGLSNIENTYFGELLTTMSELEVSSQEEFLNSDNMETLMKSYPPTIQADIREAYAEAFGETNFSERQIGGTNKKVVYKIANKYWNKPNIVDSYEDVRVLIDDFNDELKNKLNKNTYALDIWAAISNNRKTLADAKLLQTNITSQIKNKPEYKNNKVYKRDADDFATVNLNNLSLSDVRAYSRGYLELINNGIPNKRSYDIVNRAVADKTFNYYLLPYAGKYGKGKGLFGLLPQAANPATFATAVAKYDKNATSALWNAVYGRILEDVTNSETQTSKINKTLQDIYNKENLTFKDSVRAAMYGTIRSTFSSPSSPNYYQEISENIEIVLQNAKNKLSAHEAGNYPTQSKKEIESELQVAEELKKTILERKTLDRILTDGQQKLYNAFREFAQTIETDIKRNAKGVWGSKEFVDQFNYFPTSALGSVKNGDLNGKDPLVPNQNVNNLYDAVVENKNYGNVKANQAGSSKLKTKPKGYFYDYDMLSITKKWAQPTVFDYNASRTVKVLNLMLNHNKDINNVMNESLVSGLKRQIRSIVGASSYNMDDFGNAIQKTVFSALDKYTTALIATTGQFLTQGSSIVSAITIAPPKHVAKALKAMTGIERGNEDFSTLNNWLKENGLGIQYRDALFYNLRHIHGAESTKFKRLAVKLTDLSEDMTRFAFTQTDKYAARLVWFAAYFNAGGTLQKPTREAVLEAERMVGILQNMNHATLAAPMFRSQSGSGRLLVKALFALKSFSLNSAINIYSSAPNFFKSAEARKVFTSHLAMTFAYHATLVYLTRPLYEAITSAIFGGDDDDEEDKKRFGKGEEIITNSLWDATVGQGSPNIVDGMLRAAYNKTAAKYIHASEDEKFDQYLDSPIFSARDASGVKGEGLSIMGDFVDMGMDVASWNEAYLDYLEEPTAQKKDKLDAITFLIFGNILAFNRAVPFRGDIKRIMNKHAREMKKAAQKTEKGVQGENDGTFFEMDTEQPEFELNLPEVDNNE